MTSNDSSNLIKWARQKDDAALLEQFEAAATYVSRLYDERAKPAEIHEAAQVYKALQELVLERMSKGA